MRISRLEASIIGLAAVALIILSILYVVWAGGSETSQINQNANPVNAGSNEGGIEGQTWDGSTAYGRPATKDLIVPVEAVDDTVSLGDIGSVDLHEYIKEGATLVAVPFECCKGQTEVSLRLYVTPRHYFGAKVRIGWNTLPLGNRLHLFQDSVYAKTGDSQPAVNALSLVTGAVARLPIDDNYRWDDSGEMPEAETCTGFDASYLPDTAAILGCYLPSVSYHFDGPGAGGPLITKHCLTDDACPVAVPELGLEISVPNGHSFFLHGNGFGDVGNRRGGMIRPLSDDHETGTQNLTYLWFETATPDWKPGIAEGYANPTEAYFKDTQEYYTVTVGQNQTCRLSCRMPYAYEHGDFEGMTVTVDMPMESLGCDMDQEHFDAWLTADNRKKIRGKFAEIVSKRIHGLNL
jgi:hypothetical protein